MIIDPQIYLDKALDMLLVYGPRVLLAVFTLFFGSWLVRILSSLLEKALLKMSFDETLRPYLVALSSSLLKAVLYISVIGMIGVQTTSIIAVLGAAGFAIGMALQGSLGNFAGGVLILVFKPFKVGDLIETQGTTGVVESIQPFTTVLISLDNIVHYMPNGILSSGDIKNYSVNQERRVDLTFGIGYSADIDKAKEVFSKVINSCEKVLKNKKAEIHVSSLGDSSVNFVVRPYCKPTDYWEVYYYMQEHVKKELDIAGISIPFPQRDVHLYSER